MKLNKLNLILSIILFFLLTIFCFSFFNVPSNKKNISELKTSLVNPKYQDMIYSFELRSGGEILDFYKSGDIWFCGIYTEDGSFFVPALSEKVRSFIFELCSIKKIQKMKIAPSSISGLVDDNSFSVTYGVEDKIGISNGLHEIKFGNLNFSETGRYLQNGNNSDVYLSDLSFEKFIYISPSQWYDPFILTRNTGADYKAPDVMNSNIPNLWELRHGGISFYRPETLGNPEKTLKIEMGDTGFYILDFYRIPDEKNFHLQVHYENPLKKTSLDYGILISEWTYQRFDINS